MQLATDTLEERDSNNDEEKRLSVHGTIEVGDSCGPDSDEFDLRVLGFV